MTHKVEICDTNIFKIHPKGMATVKKSIVNLVLGVIFLRDNMLSNYKNYIFA